jgi:TonB family protein
VPGPNVNSDVNRSGQRKRLALALGLLAVALAAILIKERDFWFGPDEDADVLNPEVAPLKRAPTVAPNKGFDKTRSAAPVKKVSSGKPVGKVADKVESVDKTSPEQPVESSAVATERTILPPLDVEIVAGDKHSAISPGGNATNIEISSDQPGAPATNAAERVPLSTTIPLTGPLAEKTYPLLAQQMKVQASVVLQAMIGADGLIQDLRVLAGPAILSSAAREAVRPWRFKPYLQNGQPVETMAKITVNFIIRIGDASVSGS